MTITETIRNTLLNEKGTDPIEMIIKIMNDPSCHMHGPEHHIMVSSCLLTAYKNAGGDIDLPSALSEAEDRGSKVPGGVCGRWGSCGAAISTGIYVSIITGASPTTEESWGMSNLMTSESLKNIGRIGGPRCCKRDSFTAIITAIEYTKENFGIHMTYPDITCTFSDKNAQCIGSRCPYNPENKKENI